MSGDGNGSVHAARLAALRERMRSSGIGAVVVGPGSDLRYLTGYHALAMERPTLLLVTTASAPVLIAPTLEELRARDEVQAQEVGIRCYGELDDPFTVAADVLRGADGPRVAVGDQLWSSFTLSLQERLGGRSWGSATPLVGALRQMKDATELALLRRAASAIDRVHARMPEVLRPGRSEQDVARDVAAMIREEHDEVSFVIVAGGPNSASPHHEPGARLLAQGDAVVVDIGGTIEGYGSDCTRTYHLGRPTPEFAERYAALLDAQERACAAVRPGATAGSIDAVARDRMVSAGLGDAFVHRTGHGIGLDTHETPWIIAGSDVVLLPGMVFSVEPGFYLPGRDGARIEDIVAVTDDGVERLNTGPRGLVVL